MLDKASENVLIAGFSVYFMASLTAMAPMGFGAAFCALAIGIALKPAGLYQAICEEWQRPTSQRFFVIGFALAAVCILSLIAHRIAPLAYGKISVPSDFRLAYKLWYFAWPVLLLPGFRALSAEGRWKVLRYWLLAFALLSAIGPIQFFTGWPRPQGIPSTRYFHATLFLGHHLSVASIFIFPYFVALEGLRSCEIARRLGWSRAFLAVSVFFGTLTLLMTASRTLWVALPFGVALWLLWSLPRKKAIGLAALLFIALLGASQSPGVKSRMAFAGVTERQELWKANLEFFKERPFLGVGWRLNQGLSGLYFESIRPGQPYFQGHAHNNFLDLLAGTGLLGASLWLLWNFFILAKTGLAARGVLPVGISRGLFCAWIVFHLNGLTQVNFWEGKVTHQLILMAIVVLGWDAVQFASRNNEEGIF